MKSYLEKLEEYNHQLVLENKKLARACNACNCNEDDATANAGQDNVGQDNADQNTQGQTTQDQNNGAAPADKKDDTNNGSENSEGILVGEDDAEVHGNDGEVQSKPVASNVVVVEDDDEDDNDDTVEVSDGDNDDDNALVDVSDDDDKNDTVEIGDEDAGVVDGVIDIVDDDETEENDGDDIAVVDDEADADENVEDAVPITDEIKQQIIDLGVETKESDCRFSIRFENEEDPNFAEALKILADAGITGAVAITDFGAYIAVAKECPEGADDGAEADAAEPADDDTVELDDGDGDEDDTVEISGGDADGGDAEGNAPLDVTDDDDEESEDTLDESALLGGDLAEVAKQLAAAGSDEDEATPAAKDDDIEIREARANERIKENILMARKEFMKNDDKPIPESIQNMLKTKKKLFAGK